MPFKMQKNHFFQELKKYVCLSCLKFSDQLPETHLFFIWPFSDDHFIDTYSPLLSFKQETSQANLISC